MNIILLIGATGTGKTWVVKQLIKKLNLSTLGRVGMFLFHRNEKHLILGKYDGTTFEGSDKLSMAIMRDLDVFIESARLKKFKTVICEGDRFTNKTFIEKAKPIIVLIDNDGAEGRKKRQSNQTPRQIQSIQTRINNLRSQATHIVKDSSAALKLIETKLLK